MDKIPSPSVPSDDQYRFLFCQMAVETRIQNVVDDALKAGWKESEVLAAIIEIADNLMLASQSEAEADAFLNWVRGRKK